MSHDRGCGVCGAEKFEEHSRHCRRRSAFGTGPATGVLLQVQEHNAKTAKELGGKSESQRRKEQPMYRGLLKYFPRALAAVAGHSYAANQKHNPGEEMHWAREKSKDHEDCIIRHLADRALGEIFDNDGLRHATSVAWRALAALELELELELEKADGIK